MSDSKLAELKGFLDRLPPQEAKLATVSAGETIEQTMRAARFLLLLRLRNLQRNGAAA